MPRGALSKWYNSPVSMAQPCCRTPGAALLISQRGLVHALHGIFFSQSTTLMLLGLLCSMIQNEGCISVWTCCRTLSCVSPHSSLATWHASSKMESRSTSPLGIYCLQNPKRPARCCTSFFVTVFARDSLSFTLQGMSGHASDRWNPKSFTDVTIPEYSQGPSTALCSTCLLLSLSTY